jgi:hypothetical protein
MGGVSLTQVGQFSFVLGQAVRTAGQVGTDYTMPHCWFIDRHLVERGPWSGMSPNGSDEACDERFIPPAHFN